VRARAWVAASVMVVALVGAGPAAFADTSTVLTITSPSAGATVAGQVAVGIHVVPGTAFPYTVSVRADDGVGGAVAATVKVPAGCGAACDVVATLDLGAPNPTSGPPAIADGPITLSVQTGVQPAVTESLVLADQRPTLTCTQALDGSFCPLSTILGTAAALSVSVHATPGGSPLTGVTYTAFNGQIVTMSHVSGDVWTGQLDVSTGYSVAGRFDGSFTATDSRGISSAVLRAYGHVDRALQLSTATPLPSSVPDDLALTLNVAHQNATGVLDGVSSVHYDTTVDGVPTRSQDLFTPVAPTTIESLTVYPWDVDALPTGQHTLSITVRDSLGATGTWMAVADVTSTMSAVLQVAPGTPYLHVGVPVPVSATFTSTDSYPWHWTLSDNGTGVDAGGPLNSCTDPCPVTGQEDYTWTPTTVGVHTLTWDVIPKSGGIHHFSATATVLPNLTATLATPRPAAPGTAQAYAGTASLTGGRIPAGATVALQYQAIGSTAWSTIATPVVSATGRYAATVRARPAGAWRVVPLELTGQWWAGAPSKAILVKALPVASLALTVPKSGHVRASTRIATAPAGTAVSLQVYRSRRWITLVVSRLPSTHAITWTVALTHGRTWDLRVALAATTTTTTALSSMRAIRP
jgi:hypothetical protein